MLRRCGPSMYLCAVVAEEALHILTCAKLLLIDYTSHGSDVVTIGVQSHQVAGQRQQRLISRLTRLFAVSTLLLPWPWPEFQFVHAVLIAEIKQRCRP